MARYPIREPHLIAGRKQPIGYTFRRETGNALFVAGHYEGACGGCDNLSQGLDYIYELIYEATARSEDVIFEGLIVASDWRRCVELRRNNQLLIIGLNTSLADCCKSVDERRAERALIRGKEAAPLRMDPDGVQKNTRAKYNALLSQQKYFAIQGLDFRVLDRQAALQACIAFLDLVSVPIHQMPV